MTVTIERRVRVNARPGPVFAHVHDPGERPSWDPMVDLARLEDGDGPAPGARVHLRGRRNAPSWVGEYEVYEPPRRSTLRYVEGVGMPFRSYVQTVEVAPAGGGSDLIFRIVYETGPLLRVIEPFTLRRKLMQSAARAVENVRRELEQR